MFTVPNIQSESNLLALSQAKKLSTQMKNHSHASRIPSPDQSPTCHSAEWKTPLLPCPTSDSHDMGLRTVLQSRRPKINAYSTLKNRRDLIF
ncbi:hypothetical protein TNCV_2114321 [Trichonephila clavipes]|nr:hypothetical protein TNCV_2114321 [Trichonephila clavipes]